MRFTKFGERIDRTDKLGENQLVPTSPRMTDDPLEGHEFTTGEDEERSPEEFVDLLHDPDILYYHIKESHAKAQKGLDVDAGDKVEKVQAFAKVEVFQSAIQYVEAFSIYLIAYLKGRENLIEDLTTTYPGDVEDSTDSPPEVRRAASASRIGLMIEPPGRVPGVGGLIVRILTHPRSSGLSLAPGPAFTRGRSSKASACPRHRLSPDPRRVGRL